MKKVFGWILIIGGIYGVIRFISGSSIFGSPIEFLTNIAMLVCGIWLVTSPKKEAKKAYNKQLLGDYQPKSQTSTMQKIKSNSQKLSQNDKTRYENLRLIKDLWDSGALTKEEFEKEKQKILDE